MSAENPLEDLGVPAKQRPSPGVLDGIRGTIIWWLVAASLLGVLIFLYFLAGALRSEASRNEVELQLVQQDLANVGTPDAETQQLMNDLAEAQAGASRIEAAYAAIAVGHADWSSVMAAIGNYNPADLTLASLTQEGSQVTLNGRAIGDAAVIAYARSLEESDLFSRVVVQSVRTIATPFATPVSPTPEPGTTLTPTATITPTATPTPTPNPLDEYETDDFDPVDIFLGQPQLHNFYPVYDVDRVSFLAKNGRYYRIYTSDLAPGVDTFLSVDVGGVSYTSDDVAPGNLSSEVSFQVTADRDVEVVVKVTNRGSYRPESWYRITAEEVVPTATPTLTPTGMPTPTPTETSTSTPPPSATPEDTPTPTSDLRDTFEPDDTAPKPIAIRETQKHNFYPNDDVDQVEFLAKAGRTYRVYTSDLASGVDTFLKVSVGGVTHTNDDVRPGNLSSEIVFQVETTYDEDATVRVTNRGQYGPDNWYLLTVEEVIPTATPTPGPTNTPKPTATESASWRPSGVALLIRSYPGANGDRKPLAVPSADVVEFVIVLELKVE